MKKLVLLFFLIYSIANITYAQTGILRGKVIDKSTGEELIGTTVMLVGTTQGAATDLDGNYSVVAIEPGLYSVKISFISYESRIIENVEIRPDDVTILHASLAPVSVGLTEVVVKAKAVKHTETALLTMQRKSATLIDGISAQQISRTGDSDAAGALKRVTGISVEGGKYVYIRGLGDRYSKSVLNGAEIPGLDPNRNTVQMDLFPSNIIENMIVHKTFSPDLPGSFTGGYVNVVTKDFPEKMTFQFSTSLGYNTNSSLRNDYLSYEGGNMDWLGLDDGTRDIPSLALGKYESYDVPAPFENNEELSEITRSFNRIWKPEEKESFLNHSHSLSLGNQTTLFGNPLGFIGSLSYNRNYNFYDDGAQNRYRLVGSTSTKLNTDSRYDDSYGNTEILWGGLLNLSYKFSNNHKLSINFIRNQNASSEARYMYGEVASDGSGRFRETRTIKFVNRVFTSGQLKGEHYFEDFYRIKVNWLSSYTISQQDEPDLRFFTNSFYPNAPAGQQKYSINTSEYSDPARYYRDMEELNFDNKLDIIIPFESLGRSAKFKMGGAYVYKDRDFNEKRFNFTTQYQELYNGELDDYFTDANMTVPAPGQLPGIYVLVSQDDDRRNSYTAMQNVYSFYGMVDMQLLSKLRIIAGLRYEITDINSESDNPNILEKGELNDNDFLPALNLTWELKENMNLRAAYSRTLARPSFRELAPYASFDFQGDYVTIGNANLKRTLIDNADLRWEYYMTPGEIISVSGFFKRFQNPIERTFNPEAGNDELTWRNVDEAQVYGIEFEFRKQLDFIDALKNFKFGGNVTFVKSVVSLDEKELQTIHATEPEYPDTRVMFGQSPYIVNALLSYNSGKAGLNGNLSYNVIGKRLVMVILGGTPNVFEQPHGQLNLNISKNFGERITIKLSANNILNPDFKNTYTRWDENSTWRDEEYVYSSYTKGTTFSLGFTYLIN